METSINRLVALQFDAQRNRYCEMQSSLQYHEKMKKKALCTASFFISTKFCRFNAEPTEKSLRLYKVCGIENNVFLHTFTHAFFTLRFEVVLEVDKDIAEIFVKEVDAPFAPLFHPGVKWGQRYVVTHLSHL